MDDDDDRLVLEPNEEPETTADGSQQPKKTAINIPPIQLQDASILRSEGEEAPDVEIDSSNQPSRGVVRQVSEINEHGRSTEIDDQTQAGVSFEENEIPSSAIQTDSTRPLRCIVIDGNNVAFAHGLHRIYSCEGIKKCIAHFTHLVCIQVVVFVPKWRREDPNDWSERYKGISDQHLLEEMNQQGIVHFTPSTTSRSEDEPGYASYDDRFIIKFAKMVDGVIISNDRFRDMMRENSDWESTINESHLGFSFEGDTFKLKLLRREGSGDTADDKIILEKFYRQSRNSVEEPSRSPVSPQLPDPQELRSIILHGNDIAMCHGNSLKFSCKGIDLAIKEFHRRGHRDVTAIVDRSRAFPPSQDHPITDQHILEDLREKGMVLYKPEFEINEYLVLLAHHSSAVIVSNHRFEDIWNSHPDWRITIAKSLLGFCFPCGVFMLPDDPLGSRGVWLEEFLTLNFIKRFKNEADHNPQNEGMDALDKFGS